MEATRAFFRIPGSVEISGLRVLRPRLVQRCPHCVDLIYDAPERDNCRVVYAQTESQAMSACREPRPLEPQQMHRVPMLVSQLHRFRIVRHARPGTHCPKLCKVPGLNNLIRSVENAAQLLTVLLPLFFLTERCFMPLPLACERRLVAVLPGFQSSRLTPIDRVPRDERNDTRNSSGDDRTGLTRRARCSPRSSTRSSWIAVTRGCWGCPPTTTGCSPRRTATRA
jgi:hypothetical protein